MTAQHVPGSDGAARLVHAADGLDYLHVETPAARATVCLQGAQILEYASAASATPLLWMSETAVRRSGHALRGGIPICWPWFGAAPPPARGMQHGYARTAPWRLDAARRSGDEVTLDLRMLAPRAGEMTPLQAQAELCIRIGRSLSLELRTRNLGQQELRLTEALHAYLRVGDVRRVRLGGLDGARYVDKLAHGSAGVQHGDLRFEAAVDRMFVGTESECVIHDPVLSRRIFITKFGSQSTVVWNPWQEGADAIADMRGAGWQRMLCVEAGNVDRDALCIAAGAEHRLGASYRVQDLPGQAGG